LADPATTWDCYGNTLQKWVWNPPQGGDTAVAQGDDTPAYTPVPQVAQTPDDSGLYDRCKHAQHSDTALISPCIDHSITVNYADEDPTHIVPSWADNAPSKSVVASNELGDVVPFDYENRAIHLSVFFGGRAVRVLLDTGATNLSINETIAGQLIASSDATEGEPVRVVMADNSTQTLRTVVIGTLTVRNHSMHNVRAAVEPGDAEPLLGMAILNQISGGKFTIDTANNKLVLG
jgi:hypothetical protein